MRRSNQGRHEGDLNQISDVQVVSVCTGAWNISLKQNEEQRALAQLSSVMKGADVIIGTHPHVLQPMDSTQRRRGQ